MSIDIVILTKNESKNLPACLASFRGLGQAVIIDDGSLDGTGQIAKEAGALVYERVLDDFSSQRNYALEVSKSDWVFFLDADERFTPELIEAVKGHVEGPRQAGRVLRKNFAFGRKFRFGHLAPDRVTRLFPKGEVKWVGEVHERAETGLPVKDLDGHLFHLTYRDWEHFLGKMERYARVWAYEAAKKGKKCGVFGALAKCWANFFKNQVLKLGILDGPFGWAVNAVSAYYTLSKYLILSSLCPGQGPEKKADETKELK
ncbi:MAG: glycosyltransferase family 2 protein [Deltaproteobacteria bacterium]|jgi:glycosyltransferase involved in cell wall biosynthesis|nr:glycosyltransferase family 2 protein [Deltaproteobacteria bacterium]